MKYCFLFLILSITSQAQIVRGLAGFSIFKNDSFVNSRLYNFGTGVEFKVLDFYKPELEFNFTLGIPNEVILTDDNLNITRLESSKIIAANFSCTQKFAVFMDKGDRTNFFVFLKYNYSIVNVDHEAANYDMTGFLIGEVLKEKLQQGIHALGFGVGLYYNFPEKQTQTIVINLYFNNLDFGKVYNQLKNSQREINTRQMLGLGINYYFNF